MNRNWQELVVMTVGLRFESERLKIVNRNASGTKPIPNLCQFFSPQRLMFLPKLPKFWEVSGCYGWKTRKLARIEGWAITGVTQLLIYITSRKAFLPPIKKVFFSPVNCPVSNWTNQSYNLSSRSLDKLDIWKFTRSQACKTATT